MTLKEYSKQFGIRFGHLAKLCGISKVTMSHVSNGKQKPGFELALTIERVTNGHVGRENWYPQRPAEISITIGKASL